MLLQGPLEEAAAGFLALQGLEGGRARFLVHAPPASSKLLWPGTVRVYKGLRLPRLPGLLTGLSGPVKAVYGEEASSEDFQLFSANSLHRAGGVQQCTTHTSVQSREHAATRYPCLHIRSMQSQS